MSKLKQCLVCNNTFEPCSTCERLGLAGWRIVVCSEVHWYYHYPIISYIRNMITKEQARQELQDAINTYGMPDFNDNIKDVVKEILADDVVKTKTVSKKKK